MQRRKHGQRQTLMGAVVASRSQRALFQATWSEILGKLGQIFLLFICILEVQGMSHKIATSTWDLSE